MKYYDTYEEAKAAYPSADEILTTGKNWRFSPKLKGKFTPANWDDCEDYRHPDERTESETDGYCMGDTGWIIATPPKTRTEYVKVELSTSEIAKAMIDGEVFYNEDGSESFYWNETKFVNGADYSVAIPVVGLYYRAIEKEIDWRDEASNALREFFRENPATNSPEKLIDHIGFINEKGDTATQADFLRACRTVLRATGELE